MPQENSTYAVGEGFSRTFTFDVKTVKEFAILVGDMSPLHHDEEFAKTTRFGGPIVSGTHYSAMMMGMVGTYLTERHAGLGLEFKFRKAVSADNTVRMEWRIVRVNGLYGAVVSARIQHTLSEMNVGFRPACHPAG
jgi:acyl dehydratase